MMLAGGAATVTVEALDPSDLDVGVVAHYGDPVREQRLLATDVGLVDRGNRGVISVSGPDRLSWLHSITTQHVTALTPFTGTELLFLSPNGHVEHHAVVLDDGVTTWLDTEPDRVDGLVEYLNRMRFLLRVEPVRSDWAVLSLVGPNSMATLTRLWPASEGPASDAPATDAPASDALVPPRVAPVPGPKFATGAAGLEATTRYAVVALPGGGYARRMSYGIDLLLPPAAVGPTVAELAVPLAGIWAFEALRVADRRARLGRDTDHRTLPSEVGWLAPAVHLEKGCYRGQETIARVHHLGRPPRRLVLLHLDGIATDALPTPGTPVIAADGRAVGFVGTAARHYELGQIALAVVKKNVADDAVLLVGPSTAAIDPD